MEGVEGSGLVRGNLPGVLEVRDSSGLETPTSGRTGHDSPGPGKDHRKVRDQSLEVRGAHSGQNLEGTCGGEEGQGSPLAFH